jgi:hypothetical protein
VFAPLQGVFSSPDHADKIASVITTGEIPCHDDANTIDKSATEDDCCEENCTHSFCKTACGSVHLTISIIPSTQFLLGDSHPAHQIYPLYIHIGRVTSPLLHPPKA